MTPADLLVFGLAARLGRFAHEVEKLSTREVRGWLKFYEHQAAQRPDDGAVDLKAMTPAQLRAAFPGR